VTTQLSPSTVDRLRSSMRGEVLTPGDAAYDEARKIWNGDIDRRPAVIARCASVDDVKAALAFGRASGLRIAVKGGGHSFPGHSIADGALMLDLRPMNKVDVDAANRRGSAEFQCGAPLGRVRIYSARRLCWRYSLPVCAQIRHSRRTGDASCRQTPTRGD